MKPVSRASLALMTSLLVLSLAACSGKKADSDTEHGASEHGEQAHANDAHGNAATVQHWTYEGAEGPTHWGDMGGANTVCGTGHRQSPVDVSATPRSTVTSLKMAYHSSPATIQNNGHTVVITPSDGGGVELDGKLFKLKQFHFHSPSEHAINGRSTAMETHFVHQDSEGHYLVLSVMSDIGAADPVLGSLWTYLPSDPGQPVPLADLLINAQDLMPGTQDFYVYSGSLTTPPCTEEVTWMIYTTPLTVSAEQADAFQRLIGPNARPLQARNTRDFFHVIGTN